MRRHLRAQRKLDHDDTGFGGVMYYCTLYTASSDGSYITVSMYSNSSAGCSTVDWSGAQVFTDSEASGTCQSNGDGTYTRYSVYAANGLAPTAMPTAMTTGAPTVTSAANSSMSAIPTAMPTAMTTGAPTVVSTFHSSCLLYTSPSPRDDR